MMTRDEHLDWCKKRAIEYLELNDYKNAVISMLSDLNKHEETMNHVGSILGIILLSNEYLSNYNQIKKWIEGFN